MDGQEPLFGRPRVLEVVTTPPDAQAYDEHSPGPNPLRVEHALHRLQASWLNRKQDPGAVERGLDDLDTAIGLWLDGYDEAAQDKTS
jgi:hypothetical protein